jgi:hypothetical protein
MIPLGEPAFYSGWNHAKTISFSLIIARSLVVGKKNHIFSFSLDRWL